MRAVVVGSRSFIGSRLIELLRGADVEVLGIDLPGWDICGDLPFENDDIVVHLAAWSTDSMCSSSPLEAMRVNVEGTLNVARLAYHRMVKQVIFASTEWVYGESNQVVGEEDAANPNTLSLYAWTKSVGENILIRSGVENVTVLRFGIVYGDRRKNWGAVESIYDSFRSGRPVVVGRLDTSRRYIHVDDVCRGIVASIGKPDIRVYNLAGDRDVSLRDICVASRSVSGRDVAVAEKSGNVTRRRPDNSKAKRELSWSPEVSIEEGLARLELFLRKSEVEDHAESIQGE